MKTIINFVFILTFLFVTTVRISSAFERPLQTEEATPGDISGIFTLILYGGSHSDDLETIAFLDLEGDQYYLEPFAPPFDYTVKKSVPSGEALREAEEFVSFHNAFWQSQLLTILDRKGSPIGYEVRPLYMPFVYGLSDILDVYYWPKEGGKIKIKIRLVEPIDRARFPGTGDLGVSGN